MESARMSGGPRARPRKVRIDQLLVDRGLAPTRQKAQALVLAGDVWTGERRVDKAGDTVASDTEVRVTARKRFVSRGGDKLEGALASLGGFDDLTGRTCVDVGASTGGFTDCLLARGALKVYAVDVGWGQLDATDLVGTGLAPAPLSAGSGGTAGIADGAAVAATGRTQRRRPGDLSAQPRWR